MSRWKYVWKLIFDGRGRPPAPTERPQPGSWPDDGITGSCLGHSTVLMNFLGLWILTDPVFSLRVGPGIPPLVLGPKRYLRPALKPRDFPRPDLIVLSHAHFDHFDTWSLLRFPWSTPIVTARETKDLLHRRGFRNVHEVGWGESVEIERRGQQVRVTGLEVVHWGARTLRDHHRGYNGYLMERGGHSVCFAGDTAYTRAFSQLAARELPLDLMIMPVGAYDPWIRNHCDPEQAVAMANQAGARGFVPVHHQTFRLSNEPMGEPAERVRRALAATPERLLAVNVGETFRVLLRRAAG